MSRRQPGSTSLTDNVVRQQIPGGLAPDSVVRQQIPGGLAPDTVIRGGNVPSQNPSNYVFLRNSRRQPTGRSAAAATVSPSRAHGNRPTPRPIGVNRNSSGLHRYDNQWHYDRNLNLSHGPGRGDLNRHDRDRFDYHDRCNYWYYRGYRPRPHHVHNHYYDYYDTCSSFAFGFSVYDSVGSYYPVYPVYTPVYYPETYVAYPQPQAYPEGYYEDQTYTAPQEGLPPTATYGNAVEQMPEAPPSAAPSMELPDAANIRVPDEHVQQLMQQGLAGFEKREYENAARTFLQAAMSDPDNVDALLAYAVARFATGDYDVSAIAIRRGLRKFPGVVNAAFDIRGRYTDINDFERHLIVLADYLQRYPESVDGWIVLGFVRHFSDQRELAGRTFELVKRLSPEDVEMADAFIQAEDLPQLPEELLEEIPSDSGETELPREPGNPSMEAQAGQQLEVVPETSEN